ncbi:RluA family pseudouridine synthase [Brevibacillus migulae]|uniref:RluA family pseudouridine synthase n=1 Tax=Brevibacillus migulae TaxID=1644114 RepID=UPI00106E16A4|nr:RluA family pseudouridine synthase [Brevibacillus migulae]
MKRSNWLDYVVTAEEAGMTVEQIVKEKLAVSGRMLQRLTRSKGVLLNRKAPFLQKTVKAGDTVSVRVADKAREQANEAVDYDPAFHPEVLFEDEHFLIVNKQAGLMVHPTSPGQKGTLVQLLTAWLAHHGKPSTVHAVHRLDKETSGTILFAKSGYAHQLADRMLREGTIKREYIAVLCGQLEEEKGTVRAAIGRDPFHHTRRRVTEKGDDAVTHYAVMARSERYTLARVWLDTGRTHQIRVHFQHIGCPLAGDRLYGGSTVDFGRQALHAYRLAFPHPIGGEAIEVTAKLPEDLNQLTVAQFAVTLA